MRGGEGRGRGGEGEGPEGGGDRGEIETEIGNHFVVGQLGSTSRRKLVKKRDGRGMEERCRDNLSLRRLCVGA